jgi:transposase-like protein
LFRQFEPIIIPACVRWYGRFSLSLRTLEGLMAERGLMHRSCRHRTRPYANNRIESDHRSVKRLLRGMQGLEALPQLGGQFNGSRQYRPTASKAAIRETALLMPDAMPACR